MEIARPSNTSAIAPRAASETNSRRGWLASFIPIRMKITEFARNAIYSQMDRTSGPSSSAKTCLLNLPMVRPAVSAAIIPDACHPAL